MLSTEVIRQFLSLLAVMQMPMHLWTPPIQCILLTLSSPEVLHQVTAMPDHGEVTIAVRMNTILIKKRSDTYLYPKISA